MLNTNYEINILENKYSINNYKGLLLTSPTVLSYGKIPILLSAPHSVKQKREGKIKAHEFYTGAITEYLAEKIGCSVITKQYLIEEDFNDDANYEDYRCAYKTAINQFLQQNKVNYSDLTA